MRAHLLRRGGLAVALDGDEILILRGRQERIPVLPVSAVALLADDGTMAHMDAVLATVGALLAFGVPVEAIREGLRGFAAKISGS